MLHLRAAVVSPRFVLPAPQQPSVEIVGSETRFPVRRIFCVGRNYAEHAREMGNDDRDPPFFFMKPADALVGSVAEIPYPTATEDLHHEAELVVAIGMGGTGIAPMEAQAHIWGFAPGNDLTRRDLQAAAKAARRPWDMAKGFDRSAVCGALMPAAQTGPLTQARITCTVNGEVRQDGDIRDMIWSIPEIIAHLSDLVALAPGDLIYTGTPAGVGPLVPGDVCTIDIHGIGQVSTRIA